MLPVDTTVIYGYPVSEIASRSLPGEILHTSKHERPRFVQPEGFSLGPHWIGVTPCVPRRSGFIAQHRAVANRVARPYLKIGPRGNRYQLLRDFRNHVRLFCKCNLKPFAPSKTFDFEEWLSKTHYEAWRKDELRKVRDRFPHVVTWSDVKKHSRPKSFIKLESYPLFKFPRGIHARDDWVKGWIGPVIKEIEQEVYRLPQFIKHVPVDQRPRYVKEHVESAGCVYAATDYSSFESSFSPEIMSVCEFELYRFMTKQTKAFRDIEMFQALCCGKNRLAYKDGTFTVSGRRMSGEMTTSLGNGWTNLMIATFLLKNPKVRCVVEGDDGLFALHPDELTKFTPDKFAELGFTIKQDIHKDIETASFCGIVYASDVGLNLADPIQELINFGWSLGPIRTGKSKELLKAKAVSLGYEYPGCPVMAALARYVIRVLGSDVDWDYVARTMDLWHRDRLAEVRQASLRSEQFEILMRVPVHPHSRYVVERKFGLSSELQMRTEAYLDGLNVIQPLDMPWLSSFVHKDNVTMSKYVWTFPAGTDVGKIKTIMPWHVRNLT